MKEEVRQILSKLQSIYKEGWDTLHMPSLFKEDPSRFEKFHVHYKEEFELLYDYSKNHITKETLDVLLSLPEAAGLSKAIDDMFNGERINFTEDRSVLHVALRHPEGMGFKEVVEVRERMGVFVEKVRSGEWKGYTGKRITDIINIGIGGSDLGPYMVCEALAPFTNTDMPLRAHFVSNIDGTHLAEVLRKLNRETCLFIIASKTFTTLETLTNAYSAKEWFLKSGDPSQLNSEVGALPNASDVAKHFIAVSTNKEKVTEFGIAVENMFEFWDWVGGRYSLWSSIGISIALYIGYSNFLLLLRGAYLVDEHFRNAPFASNIPVLMAVIGILNNNILNAKTYCVVPYDQYLHRFSAYLQQLDMESNGKHVSRDGKKVDYSTGPIVWGEPGTNSQHAYFQLLHQGTNVIPIDFLAPMKTQNPLRADHHSMLIANIFAQAEALMNGQPKEEIIAEMKKANQPDDVIDRIANHRVAEGNRPSNMFLFNEVNPLTMGALIAMYEHKVFVQGIIWNINSFDQWGVELGKQLAKKILPELKSAHPVDSHDSSTNALINFYKTRHHHHSSL